MSGTQSSPSPRDPISIAVRRLAAHHARLLLDPSTGNGVATGDSDRASIARQLLTLVRRFPEHLGPRHRATRRALRDLRAGKAGTGDSLPDSVRGRLASIVALADQPHVPPTTEASARRGSRRALARTLRKLRRRGKRHGIDSGATELEALLPILHEAHDLATLFRFSAAPEIDLFLQRTESLIADIRHAATDDAAREAAARAHRRYRRRRTLRLAVPAL